MGFNDVKFNHNFYKTGSFWFGVLVAAGIVVDFIVKYKSAFPLWLTIILGIYFFASAFLEKKN